MCDEVRLVRYDLGETPWGFRITGGRDFGTPLLVVKVVGGSIAALSGVQVGDLIRGINYVPTNDFTHLDAQRAILQSGDTLILNLLKGGEYEPPEIPVIDIQSPEDKEVEEIAQQEDLESAFVIKLNRSGRISTVEEIPTPNVTPSTTPEPRRASSTSSGGEKRRKSSGGSTSSHSEKTTIATEEVEKKSKPKISVTVNDSGPINIQPPSYEDATKNKTESKKASSKQQEVTLTEEMRVETSMKKTTTEIKERTEEEFVMGVRDQILSRAHNENRELTEDEIAEMMAGEAEVIEAPHGKEVIGVNFQKFIPKCDFIKESEVFKALQEEQIKKERTEEQQLAKDPLKRFSKFLIKPKTEKPIPKPKPIHVDPMPWQERLNSPTAAPDTNTKTSLTQPSATEKKNEIRKESLKIENESNVKENRLEQTESEETESVFVSTVQESEEKLMMRIGKSEKEEYNEVVRNKEDELEQEQPDKNDADEEIEDIEWKAEKKDKRKDSGEVSQKKSSLATEEGRRSKNKKVGFVGLEFKEDIEKQLSEIQKELLTLQRLPIEIQNHLLVVQQTLQDIVAQRMQSPTNGDDEVEDTEKEKINDKDESIEKPTDEDDVEREDKKESIDEDVDEQNVKKSDEEEESVKITEEKAIEESEDVDVSKTTTTENESTSEEVIKENETVEENKDLPHGQEDVEMCESKVKPALPLTPQMRPLVLPGGRKWHQPRDAYTEEYIAETLVSQSEVLIGTTIGVNFRKYIPPKFDESNSAVYRLIHEIEDKQKKGIAERAKKGVAERPGMVPGLDEFYQPPIDKRHFFAAQLAEKKHVDNLHPQPGAPGHY